LRATYRPRNSSFETKAPQRETPTNAQFLGRRLVAGSMAVMVVLMASIAVAGILSLSTLKSAKDRLTQVKDLLSSVADNPSFLLSHSGRASDLAELHQAIELASNAKRDLSSSAPIGFLGLFPYLHTQTSGAASLATDALTASKMAAGLVTDLDHLSQTASISGGQVPLAPLSVLQRKVASAARVTASLEKPPSGLFGLVGPLARARNLFDATAARVSSRLVNASQDLIAAQTFLGGSGPRTYLVVGGNNDTMRDQGIYLSYSTVTFDGGRFTNSPSGDTGSIEPSKPVGVALPYGTAVAFGRFAPNANWQSVNLTANFPWSADVMARMFQQVTGTRVDGVIAADVPALARILAVIGPVDVTGIPTPLSSSNVADILLNQLYASAPKASQQASRQDKVAAAIAAVFSKLRNGTAADIVDLGDALAKAAAGGHLMLWSATPSEENVFQATGIGGDVAERDANRTIHLAVEDATGAKLDYFIHPSLSLSVMVDRGGNAHVLAEVDIQNQAPSGPPSLQLGPDGFSQTMPGQFVGMVNFWGPAGDRQPGSVPESGLSLSQASLAVDPGEVGRVAFSFEIPHAVSGGVLRLRMVPQPWLDPEGLSVTLRAPSWRLVSGKRSVSMAWDSTSTLVWDLSKR
jgi:hypothetical protein